MVLSKLYEVDKETNESLKAEKVVRVIPLDTAGVEEKGTRAATGKDTGAEVRIGGASGTEICQPCGQSLSARILGNAEFRRQLVAASHRQ